MGSVLKEAKTVESLRKQTGDKSLELEQPESIESCDAAAKQGGDNAQLSTASQLLRLTFQSQTFWSVKWALGNTAANKASGGDEFQQSYFKS